MLAFMLPCCASCCREQTDISGPGLAGHRHLTPLLTHIESSYTHREVQLASKHKCLGQEDRQIRVVESRSTPTCSRYTLQPVTYMTDKDESSSPLPALKEELIRVPKAEFIRDVGAFLEGNTLFLSAA